MSPPFSATSGESKQDAVAPLVAPVPVGESAEEQEILAAVDRLEHYHSTRHHFHKPGRQLGPRFGRIFVAGAGCVTSV